MTDAAKAVEVANHDWVPNSLSDYGGDVCRNCGLVSEAFYGPTDKGCKPSAFFLGIPGYPAFRLTAVEEPVNITEVAWLEARWKSAFEEGKENYSNALIVALAALKSYASEPGARVEEPAKPTKFRIQPSTLYQDPNNADHFSDTPFAAPGDVREGVDLPELLDGGIAESEIAPDLVAYWNAAREDDLQVCRWAKPRMGNPGFWKPGTDPQLEFLIERISQREHELLAALQRVAEDAKVLEQAQFQAGEALERAEKAEAQVGSFYDCLEQLGVQSLVELADSHEAKLSRLRGELKERGK